MTFYDIIYIRKLNIVKKGAKDEKKYKSYSIIFISNYGI